MEKRLKFDWCNDGFGKKWADIINKDGDTIGRIEKIRTGRFMHWSYTVHKFMLVNCDFIQISPGCQDEIREICKTLNGNELKCRKNKIGGENAE